MGMQFRFFSSTRFIHSKRAALIVLAIFVTACTSMSTATPEEFKDIEKVQAKLLGDMPVPRGARIENENSLILGSGDGWAGRVALTAVQGPLETFAFFRDNYPPAGWTMVSSTQSKNSILVFIKNDRTATIEISSGSMLGGKSIVTMTVSPRSTVVPAPKQK